MTVSLSSQSAPHEFIADLLVLRVVRIAIALVSFRYRKPPSKLDFVPA
jgi:hypothetical protein